MIKHNIVLGLFISLLVLLLVSCERDFDELKDTDQRYITFALNTNGLFSDVLTFKEDGFVMGQDTILGDNHCLRFVTYCYSNRGRLVQKITTLSLPNQKALATIKHLYKDSIYRFVFFADVVEKIEPSEYLERWFHLDVSDLKQFYIISFEQDSIAKNNILKMDTMSLSPRNQIVDVDFFSLATNGYCVFNNTTNIDKVSGYASRYLSFSTATLGGMVSGGNDYTFYTFRQSEFILPVTATRADNGHKIVVITQTLSDIDTSKCSFSNINHRPFVVTVDCQTKKITNCEYY